MRLTYSLFFWVPAFVLSATLSDVARAQAQSPPAQTAQGQAPPAAGSAAAPVTLSETPAAPAPTPAVWRQAMQKFDLGQSEEALGMLRAALIACGDQTSGKCTAEELSTLYACLGIVMAGGNGDHLAAVQAFRRSLVLNPKVGLLPEYQTMRVQAAFNEAKYGQAAPVQASPPAPAAGPSQPAPPVPPQSEEPAVAKRRGIFLAGVGAKGGALTDGYYSDGVANLSGTLTAAGLPGQESGFAIGGRVRAGAYVASGALGYVGVSGLLGSVIGPRVDNRFSFFFGGAGVEYHPAYGLEAVAAHFIGGTSIGGLMVAGGLDITVGEQVAAVTLGVEIGFGGLL